MAKLRTRTGALAHDFLMIPIAWVGAYWLRFNLGVIPEPYLSQGLSVLPVVLVTQGALFYYFGLYRGVWRFASVPDLVRILKAAVAGVSMAAVLIFLFTRMEDIPRSVFPLYAVLLVMLLGGPRLLYRWLKDHQLYLGSEQKVLIVGAGQGGEMLVRDLQRDRAAGYKPAAFVDDDRSKQGREIHGVRVKGTCDEIPDLVRRLGVGLILLAVPSATSREMRRIVALCEQAGVPFRTLPRLQDLVTGRSVLRELREVSIEDLLGREPVSLDWSAIRRGVSGRVVLVTGGGGSIGSELSRQIARLEPDSLVLLDSSEYNLYAASTELGETAPGLGVRAVLGNVCDRAAMARVMAEMRPDVVFHAAAYKHVPILEAQAREAVRNNVLGTQVVAEAVAARGCGTFVLISTDKAVNPVNVMGASKRVAELVCQNMARRHPETRFITVRFGNVLASAGSVVPRFRRQVGAGGPVTVTHPEVKRYFMTLSEACQLILQASAIGEGGDVFVLDMGEPVRISYLAQQMIVLAGKTPGEDVKIVYTGLRPGEKLCEELFYAHERLSGTGHDKLLLARRPPQEWQGFEEGMEALAAAAERGDDAACRAHLGVLVPGFREAGTAAHNVVPLEAARKGQG